MVFSIKTTTEHILFGHSNVFVVKSCTYRSPVVYSTHIDIVSQFIISFCIVNSWVHFYFNLILICSKYCLSVFNFIGFVN